MTAPIRFRVRPVFHGTDLLIEVLQDHRVEGFPDVGAMLRDALHATGAPHPDKLDSPRLALSQDRFFSYWTYPGGEYEIDDDWGGLFITAEKNNKAVIADIQRALVATGKFVPEPVDFEQFR